MNLKDILSFNFKKKLIEPKVFFIYYAYSDRQGLRIDYGYDVEVAVNKARKEVAERYSIKLGKKIEISQVKCPMNITLPLKDLISEITKLDLAEIKGKQTEEEEKVEKEKKEKNKLLQEIITNKDIDLFEKNKSLFNKNEKNFVIDSFKYK